MAMVNGSADDESDDIISEEQLYDYLMENGSIDPEVIGNPSVIGSWKFVPENIAGPGIASDMELMFGARGPIF